MEATVIKGRWSERVPVEQLGPVDVAPAPAPVALPQESWVVATNAYGGWEFSSSSRRRLVMVVGVLWGGLAIVGVYHFVDLDSITQVGSVAQNSEPSFRDRVVEAITP